MNKILITGGSGFIGTNLIEYISSKYNNIIISNIDINPPIIEAHKRFWVKCDINDIDQLSSVVKNIFPNYIIHLAAEANVKFTKLSDFKTNIVGVKNICKVANECSSVRRIIFTSTQYVHQFHGEPKNDDEYFPFTVYGESKAEGEKIVKNFGLNKTWTIIRPTNIYGPYNDVYVNGLFKVVDKGLYFHPNINVKRSYGYVGNIVEQITNILFVDENLISSKVFYVSDEPIWLFDFVSSIHKELGREKVRKLPVWVFFLMALIGEIAKKVNIPFAMNKTRYKNLVSENPINMKKTFETLGKGHYSFEAGIKTTIDWFNEIKKLEKQNK